MSYELDIKKQKLLYHIEDYFKKFGRRSNKCEICGKNYKLPGAIFEPRDKICQSCEVNEDKKQFFGGALSFFSRND